VTREQGLGATALLWIALLTMPYWINAIGGYTELASRVVVMGLAATALNFLLGYTGTLSFGHAAYFGLGAYGVGMTLKYLAPSTALGMLVGVVVGTLAAAAIGALIVRRRGVYFAMVTIAFGQVFYFIAFRWNKVTGGDDGLTGWQRQPLDLAGLRLDIQSHDTAFYYLALACFAVSAVVMALLLNSPFGRTLQAIRENERRARFLGIAVERHLWLSFVISCAFVSLAGTLYALLNNFTDPRALRWDMSGNFVIMAVLGGMRSFWGPLVGATVFVVVQDYVSSHTENWMSVVGLIFVLSCCFGSLRAVNEVSLSIAPGELRALIGANGAGKTTLFNLLSGFVAPDSGRIVFDGQDITSRAAHERVGLGIARTFQITEIFPELSVHENLRIPVESEAGLRLRPWRSRSAARQVEQRVTELLALGGLTDKSWRLAGELSHGDQRTTEILMALALRPRLLLLDEPTAGMGERETVEITELIRRLHRERSMTILLVEHDMRVVFHLADRIMVMAEGSLLAEGTAEQIAADERVQAAYLGASTT
jgi:branched-chain amino acid transport system permease protein